MIIQLKEDAADTAGKVIYIARVHTVGGRENGEARGSDGRLDVKLSLPGSPREGSNPEQLFVAGWSACFEGAIGIAARKREVTVPALTIDAEVDLHLADAEYSLSTQFDISLPDLDRGVPQSLVEEAERLCPYSKATQGNVD